MAGVPGGPQPPVSPVDDHGRERRPAVVLPQSLCVLERTAELSLDAFGSLDGPGPFTGAPAPGLGPPYPGDRPEYGAAFAAALAEERRLITALRDAILPGPGASVDLPSVRIAVRYLPAGEAALLGGDWYELTPLPDGRIFLGVGDTSGHGAAAVARMAQLRPALLGLAMTGASPESLLGWLNTLVLTRFPETTATVVCGYLDVARLRFTWAQAGHPAPILVRRGGARRIGAPEGVILGAVPDPRYRVRCTALEPGDLLLMFTDGLVERRTRDIGAGMDLAVKAARAVAGQPDLDAGLDMLIDALGGPNPEDDACLLALQVVDCAERGEPARYAA